MDSEKQDQQSFLAESAALMNDVYQSYQGDPVFVPFTTVAATFLQISMIEACLSQIGLVQKLNREQRKDLEIVAASCFYTSYLLLRYPKSALPEFYVRKELYFNESWWRQTSVQKAIYQFELLVQTYDLSVPGNFAVGDFAGVNKLTEQKKSQAQFILKALKENPHNLLEEPVKSFVMMNKLGAFMVRPNEVYPIPMYLAEINRRTGRPNGSFRYNILNETFFGMLWDKFPLPDQ